MYKRQTQAGAFRVARLVAADETFRYLFRIKGKLVGRHVLHGDDHSAVVPFLSLIHIFRSVPRELRSASLALGATKIQTIFQVVLPAAKSGIITAIVLGTGRAIGEAMAISLVSGSSVNFPLPFNSVRFLTTAIVSEMSYSAGLHKQVLFTIGLVLFAFIMIINISLTRLLKKGDVQHD